MFMFHFPVNCRTLSMRLDDFVVVIVVDAKHTQTVYVFFTHFCLSVQRKKNRNVRQTMRMPIVFSSVLTVHKR